MTLVMEKPMEENSATVPIEKQFKILQSQLVKLGMDLGLHHPDVVELSQKLDQLHNEMLKAGIKDDHICS